MGVTGLHKQIQSISEAVHISDYHGLTAGIDAFAWLHRGARSCAEALCEGTHTDGYIQFCLSRVDLLAKYHITPYMVFDGSSIPVKRCQNRGRQEARVRAMEQARAEKGKGNAARANQLYAQAVCATHDMAHELIKVLRERGIKFLVAPYEADAQLAYLSIHGIVDVVITEDSDLLAFGCKRTLFKLDTDGNGQEVRLENLPFNRELSFENWKHSMFVDMCLLAGCDYVPSIPGVGIKKAYNFVKTHRTPQRILKALEESKYNPGDDFGPMFWFGRATYHHQRVYDPETEECVFLTEPNELTVDRYDDDFDFLGPHINQQTAAGIAAGHIHPVTHKPWSEIMATATTAVAESRPTCPMTGSMHATPRATTTAVTPHSHLGMSSNLNQSTCSDRDRRRRASDPPRADLNAVADVHAPPTRENGAPTVRFSDNIGDLSSSQAEQTHPPPRVPLTAAPGLRSDRFKSPMISDSLQILHRRSTAPRAPVPHHRPLSPPAENHPSQEDDAPHYRGGDECSAHDMPFPVAPTSMPRAMDQVPVASASGSGSGFQWWQHVKKRPHRRSLESAHFPRAPVTSSLKRQRPSPAPSCDRSPSPVLSRRHIHQHQHQRQRQRPAGISNGFSISFNGHRLLSAASALTYTDADVGFTPFSNDTHGESFEAPVTSCHYRENPGYYRENCHYHQPGSGFGYDPEPEPERAPSVNYYAWGLAGQGASRLS